MRWRLVSPVGLQWGSWAWSVITDSPTVNSFSHSEGVALKPTGNGAESATDWSWRETSWPSDATQAAVELRPAVASSKGCGKSLRLLIDRIVVE